jgi:pyrimidine operon attenuation protein/uracil phosphoribosyltransferase
MGSLDITFYRDDMGESPLNPVVHDTDIPFDVTGKTIFLVDDVLYTGRTIRCALDELMDFGRPRRVFLVVLVDRGYRELPIQADFSGETIATHVGERVDVHFTELDKEDAVWISAP